MLQPTNRLTLIDAMRPPAGYAFGEAMAVTFTLDLRALLAAPAAFVLARSTDISRSDVQAEPIELLHAIRAHAGSITVFCQAGEIALPPSRRVFAFLERSVVPVTAPRGGVVHSKVWVLRYVDVEGEGEARLRVLSGSRNLTFDTSWDTLLRLDSTDSTDDTDGEGLEPIAELFDAMAGRSVGQLAAHHQARVVSLGRDLRRARFARPAGVDDLRVHVLGIRASASPLPEQADRSLVISPFVSDDFFTSVHPAPVNELVSRAEYLDGLSPSVLDTIGSAFVFDDGSNPEPDPSTDGLTAHDPGRPLRGLHAKIFVYETGRTAHLFCGSANATGAAFTSNVEVLFELIGQRGTLGINHICEGSDDEVGLRALFQIYRGLGEEERPDDEGEGSLDWARRSIGRLEIHGRVERSGDGWAVTYASTEPFEVPAALSVACWPLSAPGNSRPVPMGVPLSARFEVSLEGISGFLVVELSDGVGTVTRCVIPTTLEGVPEHRDRRLMQLFVGSADRFLRYLLALLADDAGELDLMGVIEQATADGTAPSDTPGAFGLPVLEHLVRTLRTDPAKLTALDPLVTDLAHDDALPQDFVELWSRVRAVARQPDPRR